MLRPFRLFTLPFRDVLGGLDRSLDAGVPGLLLVALGLFAGWWIYVPLHELLHAAGCLIAGGTVTKLEIDPLYGGALLARVFPFVVSGSAYAGRLSGFDTRGNDLIYLATDLAPFLLTLPGVWALRRAGRRAPTAPAAPERGSATPKETARPSLLRPFAYGLALPFALAPFLSLTGDAYEIGSILVTHLPPWSAPALRTVLRSDDLVLEAQQLAALASPPWGGFVLAAIVGILWAFLTYGLSAWTGRVGRVPRQVAENGISA